ncbi:unnamed protein product, partial [Amoebophrya sp. A25]|eukprot:GSA25T00006536001.1
MMKLSMLYHTAAVSSKNLSHFFLSHSNNRLPSTHLATKNVRYHPFS